MLTKIKKTLLWWEKHRAARHWRRLRKRHPVLNDILVDAWRAGWHCMTWNADLADQFFNRVPRVLTEEGAEILDKIRKAFFDGATEKAVEIEDDHRADAVRRASSPSMN